MTPKSVADGLSPQERKVWEQSRTVGEFLHACLEQEIAPKLDRLAPKVRPEVRDELRRALLRIYEPWPEWVLRIAAEVLVVRFPRVRKKTVCGVLKVIHWFFFEAALHGAPTPKPQLAFAAGIERDLWSMFGHLTAHDAAIGRRIEDLKSSTKNPNLLAQLEEFRASRADSSRQAWAAFVRYLEAKPEFPTALAATVDANRATFDGEGQLRETTLTPIYEKILENWAEVEAMSGPTELCRFLDPLLGNADQEKKFDRVKKLCRRVRVMFRPPCQGTSPPPPLVPPD
jgi:hypothetical protein